MSCRKGLSQSTSACVAGGVAGILSANQVFQQDEASVEGSHVQMSIIIVAVFSKLCS